VGGGGSGRGEVGVERGGEGGSGVRGREVGVGGGNRGYGGGGGEGGWGQRGTKEVWMGIERWDDWVAWNEEVGEMVGGKERGRL